MKQEQLYTFGNSPAAIILYEVVRHDPKLMRKVGRTLCEYQGGINALSQVVHNDSVRRSLMQVWFKHTQSKLESMDLTEEVKTFLGNVIARTFRIAVKE